MSLCVTLANWVSGIMPAKTRRLRPDAIFQQAVRYQEQADRLAVEMAVFRQSYRRIPK